MLLSLVASFATVIQTEGTATAAESIPALQWGPVQASNSATINLTSPTGSVTVPCSPNRGGSDLKTYSATGTLVQDISRTSIIDGVGDCIQTPAVDKNGDDYGVPIDPSTGTVGRNLLAYSGNTLKWKYPAYCSSSQTTQVAVGADGNIYATTNESDGVHLIGLTPNVASGQTQPTKVLDVKVQNDCSTMLTPFKYGIMLHGQSSGGPYFYSYTGNQVDQKTGNIWAERVNDEGRLFTYSTVTGSYHSIAVTGSDSTKTNKTTWTTTASTPGADAQSASLRPMPGGGVAVLVGEQQMNGGIPVSPTVYVKTLTILNGTGQVILNKQLLNSDANGNTYGGTYIAADNTGKVAVVRDINLPTGLSYPTTEPGVSIQVYDSATNAWTYSAVMSGDNSKAGGPYGYRFDYSNQDYSLEFATNTLFFDAHCVGNCTDTNDRLYPVNMGGVGNDYPRSTVLYNVHPASAYIALGDSFSSGEGNPPFLSGTDIPSVNTCHRSGVAYPEVISGTSSKIPALGTTGFRACSGAVSGNIWNVPQWNEGTQINWWPDTSTQLVTMTIGGNDIGFSDFGHACVFGSCDIGSPQYNTSVGLINNTLAGALTTTYQRILQYAPNAQIYVIGYPSIIANYSATDPKIDTCFYMYGGSTPWGNARGAYSLVNLLDKKISDTVTAINNPRLHFIDTAGSSSPFASHLLCSGDPWFQNIDQAFNNAAYVFHPNQAGQEGLGTIVGATINAG